LSLDEIRLEENEQPYLIEGLLPAGPSFCATVGWPKSFKSFVKQHADLHIASGKEYGGRKVRQGPVIYFTSEGIIGVKHRLIAMKLALELEPDVPFFLIPAMPNLGTAPGDYPEVKAKIDHIQQRLGVPIAKIDFDTVRRAMPGKDENTAKDMGVFVDICGKLMDDFKCVVDVNHHSPRSNGTRGSGNNTLDAALDAMWSCFRPDKGRKATVSIEFMKDSPDDGISWEIELRDYPLTGPDNRNYTPCVVDIVAKPGEALAAAQVAERAKTAAKVPLNVKAFLESFNETLHRYAKQMRAMGDGPLVQAVPLQRVRKSSTCAMSPIQRMTRGERAHFKSNSLAPENGSMSVRRPGKSNLRPLVGNTTWIWRTGHTGHTGLWSFMSPEVTLGDGIGH
jgi:hypothetical protein